MDNIEEQKTWKAENSDNTEFCAVCDEEKEVDNILLDKGLSISKGIIHNSIYNIYAILYLNQNLQHILLCQ